jgi:hypothetical protein
LQFYRYSLAYITSVEPFHADVVEEEDGVDYAQKVILRYTRIALTWIGWIRIALKKVPEVLIRNRYGNIIDYKDTVLHGVGKEWIG